MVGKQRSSGGRKGAAVRSVLLDGAFIALVVGLAFSAVSLYFMAQGFVLLHEENRLSTGGKSASATVVELRVYSGGRNGGSMYYPILSYTDAAGRQHVVDCQFSTNYYHEGKRIPIVYLPAEPGILRVVEDRLSPGWRNVLCGGLFLLIWGGCAALGVHEIRKKRRKKRRFLRKT